MILWAHHSEGVFYRALQDFIARRIFGDDRYLGDGTILAVLRDNRVVAAVIFYHWQPEFGTVEISGAGDGPWLTKGVLDQMAEYVFEEMKCQAVCMRADPDNRRVDRMARAAGFERYDIPHMRGRGKPEATFILTADTWSAGKFCKG